MAVQRESAVAVSRDYSPARAALYGAIAGLIGGIVFGMMMMMMMPGMMEMIGSIITRQPNFALGWVYHLFNSAFIGALFGLIFGRLATSYGAGLLWGVIYGFIWWILGPLILMPLLLGMNEMIFAINNDTLMSLVGHLMFGVITGLAFVFIRDRAASPSERAA